MYCHRPELKRRLHRTRGRGGAGRGQRLWLTRVSRGAGFPGEAGAGTHTNWLGVTWNGRINGWLGPTGSTSPGRTKTVTSETPAFCPRRGQKSFTAPQKSASSKIFASSLASSSCSRRTLVMNYSKTSISTTSWRNKAFESSGGMSNCLASPFDECLSWRTAAGVEEATHREHRLRSTAQTRSGAGRSSQASCSALRHFQAKPHRQCCFLTLLHHLRRGGFTDRLNNSQLLFYIFQILITRKCIYYS